MKRHYLMRENRELNRPHNRYIFFASANFIIGSLLWMCAIYPGMTYAQQQQTYYSFSYYKILPGREAELRRVMEAVDSRVQQERVNSGAISAWYLYEVLSPSGTSAEYDYVMVSATNSFKNTFETPYTFDSALKKTFPGKDSKFFTDYHSRQTGAWRLVKQEIYVGMAFADSSFPGGSQLKYIVTDFMQPKPGKASQYVKMEIDTFRLIHKERIILGAITQWGLFQLLAPFDMKIGYSHLALNFYKDIDMMVGDAKYVEGLKNTFPNAVLTSLFESAAATRDNPRAEFLRLYLYALPTKR